jgi:hypothetical protein
MYIVTGEANLLHREIPSQNPDDCAFFSRAATSPNVLCSAYSESIYSTTASYIYHYVKSNPLIRLPISLHPHFPSSIPRALTSLRDRRSRSHYRDTLHYNRISQNSHLLTDARYGQSAQSVSPQDSRLQPALTKKTIEFADL